MLKDHLLLFRLPREDSELGFDTYNQLPPIRAKHLEGVVRLGETEASEEKKWNGTKTRHKSEGLEYNEEVSGGIQSEFTLPRWQMVTRVVCQKLEAHLVEMF